MNGTYQIAKNWNQAGSLQDVVPQPKMPGLKAGRRQIGGDGLVYQDGFYEGIWLYGFQTKAQLTAFLAAAGLAEGTPSAKVTVRMPQNAPIGGVRTFRNWNAVITLPDFPDEAKYDFTVYQELKFSITRVSPI